MSPCAHLHLRLKISLLGNYVELSPCARLRLHLGVSVGVCLHVSRAIAPCSDSARLKAQTRTYTMCTTGDSPPRVVCVHRTLIRETSPLDRMVLTMGPKVNISVSAEGRVKGPEQAHHHLDLVQGWSAY